MTTLTPAPSSLGLASPALGPWFSDAGITLPAPNADLSVTVSVTAGARWLAPAVGTLGFYVATAQRPRGLAHLRQASGAPAFTDGKLVALFRLQPEVEARLYQLQQQVPSPDGTAPTPAASTRPRVRYLAVEFASSPATIAFLAPMIKPDLSGSDAEQADALGLKLTGGNLDNAGSPVAILRQPDPKVTDASKALLNFPSGSATSVNLWAFDAWGHPLDPGAVAAWWSYLATTAYANLWADSTVTRTCPQAAQITVHLVNAHEGPLSSAVLGNVSPTGTDAVRTVTSNAQFGCTVDDTTPVPRLALLPHGKYVDSLTLFASGPVHASLGRDFTRVAVVDVEEHLAGQKRVTSGASPSADETRRANDQQRASTRVNVARTTAPTLLPTIDQAMAAVTGVLGPGAPAQLVAGVLERDWSAYSPLSGLPNVAAPTSMPAPTVSALTGGGTASGGTVSNQKVLVDVDLSPALAGAWVRAWPQDFDPVSGRHIYMDGGGGLVRADGHVSLVMTLMDGDVAPVTQMGMEMLVVTAQGARLYGDVRFPRPAPAGGSPVAISSVSGNVLVCETGAIQPAGSLANVPAGAAIVTMGGGTPALVDKASLPATAFAAASPARALKAGDKVQLCSTTFKNQPAGDSTAALSATGATVNQHGRNALGLGSNPGDPLPTMERLEIAAAKVSASTGAAAIATAPALARYHELPPHQQGHPGVPAAVEVHGTGVALNGPAAVLVAEYTRERTAGFTPQLAVAAATPLPSLTAPAAPGGWAAALRTVASGVELEISPTLLQALLGTSTYPWGATTLQQITDWLSGFGISLPAGLSGDLNSIARAIDRRMQVGSQGAREGATSMVAAVGRAEDFIYIETPAIDDQPFGKSGDQLNLWGALKQRMTDRPGLQVLLCLPTDQLPGLPKPLNRVRVELAREAVDHLKQAGQAASPGEGRLAVFTPSAGPGRTVRLSSTTVVVDDAYAITGTTHLWRRGLSFDSSLAVAAFDEVLADGRPAEVRTFRQNLLAQRLGLPLSDVPNDPQELVAAVRKLGARGGGGRVTRDGLAAPVPVPSDAEKLAWNPDGSPSASANPIGWITSAIAALLTPELP